MTNASIEEDGNYLRLVAEGTWEAGYPSMEAFLRAVDVDPKVWEVRTGKPNAWPTSGWDSKNERPWTVINHQMKATLLRRDPQPLEPQVQPVTIRARKRKGTRPGRTHHGLQSTLFVTDPHFGYSRNLQSSELTPFHDRRVLDVALQIALRYRPQKIVFGGDTLDLADWSDKFIRSPLFYYTTQPAVLEASWWLAQFRAAVPTAEISVLEGNHDLRMEKALLVHLNHTYQLRPADEMSLPPAMSLPRLLALHKLDIDYIAGYPDAEIWLGDGAVITHGRKVRSAPGGTAAAVVKDSDVTEIFGHIHRRERVARTARGRQAERVIEAFCPGCACHVDYRVPGHKRGQSWQQGIAFVRHGPGVPANPVAIPVHEGKALFEGVVYTGDERLSEIRKDIGWEL